MFCGYYGALKLDAPGVPDGYLFGGLYKNYIIDMKYFDGRVNWTSPDVTLKVFFTTSSAAERYNFVPTYANITSGADFSQRTIANAILSAKDSELCTLRSELPSCKSFTVKGLTLMAKPKADRLVVLMHEAANVVGADSDADEIGLVLIKDGQIVASYPE